MRTFNQYMEFKNVEPLIWKAASLMVELEIDPKEYLELLVENPMWNTGVQNTAGGLQGTAQGIGDAAKGLAGMAGGAIGGAWNAGSQAAQGVANSAVGRGIGNWWQDFKSADRKLTKAAGMIQQAMVDPHVQSVGGAQAMLTQMIHDLTQIAAQAKAIRRP